MLGIVQKPQFDEETFEIGHAYAMEINASDPPEDISIQAGTAHFILREISPFELKVSYWFCGQMDYGTITVEDFLNLRVKITPLVATTVRDLAKQECVEDEQ